MMQQMIKELWYGNIEPFEQYTKGDKRVKELLRFIDKNQTELEEGLTERQKNMLEKLKDNISEMNGITESDAFSYGFRLGVRLMAEVFTTPMMDME